MSPLDLTALIAATRESIAAIDEELNQRVADLLAERAKLVASLTALTGEEVPEAAFLGTYAGPPVAPPVAVETPTPPPAPPEPEPAPEPEPEPKKQPVERKPPPEIEATDERKNAVLSALSGGPLRWNELTKKSNLYGRNLTTVLEALGGQVIKTERGYKRADQGPTPPPAPVESKTYTRPSDGATRRVPTHPGIEAVPEYLRYLPAAQERGPVKPRVATAELQHKILLALADHPDSLPGEIAEVLFGERDNGTLDNRVGNHFRKLREAGLIVQKTPDRVKRWKKGQPSKPGKPMRLAMHTSELMEGKEGPVAEPEAREAKEAIDTAPPVAPPVPEPEVGINPQAVARMRDWVAGQTEPFNHHKAAEVTKMSAELALRCLEALVAREIVSDESPSPDMRMFEYHKPTDPGAAAKLDQQRRPAEVTPLARGGSPVPGTGGRVKATNAEVDALIQTLQSKGADVAHAANGHFAVKMDGKQRVLISATPGSSRSVLNDRTRLRRAGYPV